MLSIAYNLGFHVAEGEKAQGHSENRELHSEEVPKAPWGWTWSWAIGCSGGVEIDFKGGKHVQIEKRTANMV